METLTIPEAIAYFKSTKILSYVASPSSMDDSIGLVLLRMSGDAIQVGSATDVIMIPRYMLVAFYMFDRWWLGETKAIDQRTLLHRAWLEEDPEVVSEWCPRPGDAMKQVYEMVFGRKTMPKHHSYATIFGYYGPVNQALILAYCFNQPTSVTTVQVVKEDLGWLHFHPVAEEVLHHVYAVDVIATRSTPMAVVDQSTAHLPPKKRFH